MSARQRRNILWLADGDPPIRPASDERRIRVHVENSAGRLCGYLLARRGSATLDDLLPAARTMCDQIVQNVLTRLADNGQRPSCQAGCAFCCRYLVPLSPPEATALQRRINALSTAQYDQTAEQFDASIRRIQSTPPPLVLPGSPNVLEILSAWYAGFNQPCPLLQAERCSVYQDRPLACREFLVTSPPIECQGHQPGRGKPVRLPVSIAESLYELVESLISPDEAAAVFLPLLPLWTGNHPVGLGIVLPATELARRFAVAIHRRAKLSAAEAA